MLAGDEACTRAERSNETPKEEAAPNGHEGHVPSTPPPPGADSTSNEIDKSVDTEPLKTKTRYVANLPTTCDEELILSIFEHEIESMKFISHEGTQQPGIVARIVFKSEEMASQAALKVDGMDFPLDVGDERTRIRVLTSEAFVEYLNNSISAAPNAAPTEKSENTAPVSDSEGEEGEEPTRESHLTTTQSRNGRAEEKRTPRAKGKEAEDKIAPRATASGIRPRESADEAVPVSDDEEDGSLPVKSMKAASTGQTPSGMLSEQVAPPQKEEAATIDEVYVGRRISEYMVANKLNWGELDNAEMLWPICDAISASHGGLPDSLLKESLLLVIQSNLHQHSNHVWARQHLQKLLKEWKREINSIKSFKRPTKFVAATAPLVPHEMEEEQQRLEKQSEDMDSGAKAGSEVEENAANPNESNQKKRRKRRMNAKRRKLLAGLMGVGEILQQARSKFATEEGELDIGEDQYGNISIGGQELTFESWAELNKIKESGVVRCPQSLQPVQIAREAVQQQARATLPAQPPEIAAAASQPFIAGAENGREKEKSAQKSRKEKVAKRKVAEQKDEGELSESDEEAHSSSASSTSEDESEDEGKGRARGRRKKRRMEERQAAPSSVSNITSMFSKFYQHRLQIARSLSLQQKAMLLEALKQSSTNATSSQQSQMMLQFMAAFMGSSLAQSSTFATSSPLAPSR